MGIDGLHAFEGPAFQDLKVMNKAIHVGRTQKEQDKVTWADHCGSGCLFNVEADPTEHQNLAGKKEYAEKLASLQTELQLLNKKIFRPLRGNPSVDACEVAIDNGGFYGPFVDVKDWYSERPKPSIKRHFHDFALRQVLNFVNRPAVEERVHRSAKVLTPFLSKLTDQNLDVCLAHQSDAALAPHSDDALKTLYV